MGEVRDKIPELLPRLRNFARRFVSYQEIDDLVSETVIKAITSEHQYKEGTNLFNWLCTIMRNRALSNARRAWRWQSWNDAFDRTITGPENPLNTILAQEAHHAILEYLPRAQREAILLAGQGLSMEEIADVTQVPVGTAKSRVGRARSTLNLFFGGQRDEND